MALRRRAVVGVAVAGALLWPLVAMAPALASIRALPAYSDILNGVSCPRPAWCMAVGQRESNREPGTGRTLAAMWNGKRWRGSLCHR